MAVRFLIEGEPGQQCSIATGTTWLELADAAGIHEWFSRVGDEYFAYGGHTSARNRIQVGPPFPYDSNPPPAGKNVGMWRTIAPWNFTLKSDGDLFILYFGFLAGPTDVFPDAESLNFHITCPAGVVVRTTAIGREFMPFVLQNMNGTLSVTPPYVTSMLFNGVYAVSINHTFTSHDVYFRFNPIGLPMYGEVKLEYPNSPPSSWLFYGQYVGYGEIPIAWPGDYNLTINLAGDGYGLWGLAVGFDPVPNP